MAECKKRPKTRAVITRAVKILISLYEGSQNPNTIKPNFRAM
jgi:hypothetical protein